MEQLSLFDAPKLLLSDYYRAIEHGQWNELPHLLDMVEKIGVRIVDIPGKRHFWKDKIPVIQQAEDKSPREMAQFWEALQPEFNDAAFLAEALHFEKYWLNRILKKLPPGENAYLTGHIHPADCYLRLGEYQKAVDAAGEYCEKISEDARLRCVQAYAYYRLNHLGKATTLAVFALFYDPLRVNPAYIYNPEVVRVLADLREQHGESRMVRALWPFETWLRELIEIPPSADYAAKIRALYPGGLLETAPRNGLDRQLYFNHLLYVCESLRLNARKVTGEIIRHTAALERADPGAFARYLDRIR